MTTSGQSGRGRIRLFNDFCGPEIPIATAVAYGTSAGGCNYYLGDFKVTGSLQDTDSGVISQSKASGYVRLSSSATSGGDGIAIGTEVVFSPVLNGTLVLECRLENYSVLTARNVFVGFCTANADEFVENLTSTGTEITLVVASVGFILDSQLTAADGLWHMPYLLASDATQVSTDVQASQTAIAGESDIVRLEIDNNGAARWYINGILEQTVGAGLAATPSTLLAGLVVVSSTTSTVASIDVDYLLIEANRDWTR